MTDYFEARTALRVARGLIDDAMRSLPPASAAYTRVLDVRMSLERVIDNALPPADTLPPVVVIHGTEYVRKDCAARRAT